MTDISLTADVVALSHDEDLDLHVLLIRRRDDPYAGCWALPGGYVELGETSRMAAARELFEETGVHLRHSRLAQIGTFDGVDRDPRGRVVSVAYRAVVVGLPRPRAGDDASHAQWVPLAEAKRETLAFDHHQILHTAIDRL